MHTTSDGFCGFDRQDNSLRCTDNFDHDSDFESSSNRSNCSANSSLGFQDSESGYSESDSPYPIISENNYAYWFHYQDVDVVIPRCNLSGYGKENFSMQIIKDTAYTPEINLRTFHSGHIVALEPHGTRFHEEHLASILLPLWYVVEDEDEVVCLCSNTPAGEAPHWEQLPSERYHVLMGRVHIKVSHFSLFTAVLVKPPLKERMLVRKDIGGRLYVDGVPGLEVNFPPGALANDMEACIRVFHEEDGILNEVPLDKALASPVIMVGPHGCHFNPGSKPVTVTLPIPDYVKIQRHFQQEVGLSVWQSSTSEGEPHVWEQVRVDLLVEQRNGVTTVTFPVSHFSFFKVLWDVLSKTLYEAKVGISNFYPYVSFSMMCQSCMEENQDTLRFGLEVICFRSDKKLPELTNYKHRVGSSLKPKLVKPGRIIIRLKSEMFEADIEAGEDASLVKEEMDFRGREFDKQFACRFKQKSVDLGAFGKVIVERKLPGENGIEPLFEYNLNRRGMEMVNSFDISERWAAVSIKELAGSLYITEGRNWKRFAKKIGCPKSEIEKLQYSGDPFLSMMNLYHSRGGEPEEFVQALHEASRELQVANYKGSPSLSDSSSTNSRTWDSGEGGGNQAGRRNSYFDNLSPWLRSQQNDGPNLSDSSPSTSASRKRSNPNTKNSSGSGKRRRRQHSEVSETISSSECESAGPSAIESEEFSSNPKKLIDGDLWDISSNLDTPGWRAVGRRLRLRESILQNIEHTHKASGFKECAYNMLLEWQQSNPRKCTVGNLYSALAKENMSGLAKQMVLKLAVDE